LARDWQEFVHVVPHASTSWHAVFPKGGSFNGDCTEPFPTPPPLPRPPPPQPQPPHDCGPPTFVPAGLTAHCSAGVCRGAGCWRHARVPPSESGKAAACALVCGCGRRTATRWHGPTGGSLHRWGLSGWFVWPVPAPPFALSQDASAVTGQNHARDQAAGTSHRPCCLAWLRWYPRAGRTPTNTAELTQYVTASHLGG